MYNELEHPAITNALRTGYPDGREAEQVFCECCGDEIFGHVFEDDDYEIMCEDCLIKTHVKEGY